MVFTAGAGTLLFHAITGGKVPIFLASSFAFIAPISFAMKQYGPGATSGALFCAGLVYLIFSGMALVGGRELLNRYLPPIVTGAARTVERWTRCIRAACTPTGQLAFRL